LWAVSLGCDALALIGFGDFWWRAAFWAIAGGLLFAVPTAMTGLMDFISLPKGHRAESVALWHMGAVLTAASIFAGSLAVRWAIGEPGDPPVLLSVGLSTVGLVFLFVGGWFGGELVFRHRLGGEPEAETEQ